MTEFELEKIIDKYSRLLWSISTKILYGIGNEQDAEECVADVFIDLWKDPDSFDSNRGNLKNWLCMKAKSKSIDRFRRLTAHMTEELSPEQISGILDPSDELIRREDLQELRENILCLEDEAKEVIVRRFFLDQRSSQISKAMGIPIRRVENVIYRTKLKLRNELGGNHE